MTDECAVVQLRALVALKPARLIRNLPIHGLIRVNNLKFYKLHSCAMALQ
jgi:hypothetical protein